MKLQFLYALFLLALFDALVGGALAARLQGLGWDQRINDLYQMGFAFSCGLTLLVLLIKGGTFRWIKLYYGLRDKIQRKCLCIALHTRYNARWQALYLLAMLLAYSEDILFYPALWTFDCIGATSLLSGGFDYNFPQFLWPWELSGWFGFVTRWFFGETTKLPTIWAMVLSAGALAGILIHQGYLNAKGQTK